MGVYVGLWGAKWGFGSSALVVCLLSRMRLIRLCGVCFFIM